MDFGKPPWSTVLDVLEERAPDPADHRRRAFVLLRASRLFVHGIVKALMDREATEGTAQELSAVELKKRMDTLDGLGGNVIRFFIVIIAGLMILRTFGLDIGPAVAGLGVVGVAVGFGAQHLVRDYLNGALILIENQFSKGDVIRVAGVSGTVEDFSLRRTTLRDLDGVVHTVPERRDHGRQQPHPGLGPHQPGRDRRLRHGHRQGDRASSTRSARRWPPTRPGSAASSRRRGSTASPRSRSTASPSRSSGTVRAPDQWAAAGELRKRLLAAFQEHGIEIPRPQRVVLAREPGRPAAARRIDGRRRRRGVARRRRLGLRPRLVASAAQPTGRLSWPSTSPGRARRPRTGTSGAAPEIENLLRETRTFPPDPAFTAQANAQADAVPRGRDATSRPSGRSSPASGSAGSSPSTRPSSGTCPFARWFVGGELNVSYNCVDRHVENGLGSKVAYHWIGEPGDTRTITYADLYREVQKAANALDALGIGKGDRVAIYMPMIPELPIAMLACARIGAPHTVVFGGFSAEALAGRINDAEAKLVITADGGWRRGKPRRAQARRRRGARVDAVGPQRARRPAPRRRGAERRRWSRAATTGGTTSSMPRPPDCPPVPLDSEHMLYLLYTSGTTAKPKGIFHTTAGYLLGTSATATEMIFDLKPDDVYWCAADIGWVTGHSYIVYGPLANATTGVMYEGTPDTPAWDRWWQIIEDYKVSILYCAPTAIRAFMKQGEEHPAKHDLSSLRVLGSVGEPINPEAWLWYHEHIGGGKAPDRRHVVADRDRPDPDLAAARASRPRSPAARPSRSPGIKADVVDGDGELACRSAAAATSS